MWRREGGGGVEGTMEGFRGDSGPLCTGTAVLGGPDGVGVPEDMYEGHDVRAKRHRGTG